MTVILKSPRDLLGMEGTKLPSSEWLLIDQQRVNEFAKCTGDHQWIHVDPVRAKDGPFGTTIAHGYLTLSLTNMFLPQMIEVCGCKSGLNVGMDKTRFLMPVLVGSHVRGTGEIISVEPAKGDSIQSVVRITIEIEGADKPALIVDTISRYYPE